MKLQTRFISMPGALLFLAGVVIGLSLSAGVVWGESEARIYSSYSGDSSMRLRCPLMISPAESGVISTTIVNLTDQGVKPVVIAEISHTGVARREDRTFTLPPGETQAAQWVVNPADVIFERLILVNILQRRYRDNPSRLGSCGILLFSLIGLTGGQTFGLIFAGSLLSLFLGGGLWFLARRPLNDFDVKLTQISTLLAGMTIAALLSALPRWWGLTLFLDAVTVLTIGIMIVEFVLFPGKR